MVTGSAGLCSSIAKTPSSLAEATAAAVATPRVGVQPGGPTPVDGRQPRARTRSRGRRSLDDLRLPRGAVDAHAGTVRDYLRSIRTSDHRRQAVLACDDRGVREQAAAVGEDSAEQRQHDVEGRRGRVRHEDVARLDPPELVGAVDYACGP